MIIVFGGSFNPVTKAHIKIYDKINELYGFTKFIFLPVSTNYHKKNLVSNDHRYNMLKIVCSDLDNAIVSKFEFEQEKYKGTLNTLNYFSNIYKEEILYVIGADNLLHVDKWINVDLLLEKFNFIVINRDNFDIINFIRNNQKLNKYLKSFHIINGFSENISSSMFRNSFDKKIIDERVYKYIIRYNLYKE